MHYLLALGLSIAAIAILFALQNPGAIAVRFLLWRLELPLALLLILVLALGATIGVLCLFPRWWRALTELKQQRHHLQELRQALAASEQLQVSQDKRIRYLESHLRPEGPSAGDR